MSSLTLRVQYWGAPDVQRTIEMAGGHSLDALHRAIQQAFEFDDDHAYAFFMNGHPWDTEFGYWSSPSSNHEKSTAAALDSLRLRERKRFVYLFDYGDEHLFEIQVVRVSPSERGPAKPRLVESSGDAPPQYPDLDDDAGGDEDPSCAHGPPDPELYGLATRIAPFIEQWRNDDELDPGEGGDDDSIDESSEAQAEQSQALLASSAKTLPEEHALALELLDKTNSELARIHEDIEHVVEGNVLGWLLELPHRLAENNQAQEALALFERLIGPDSPGTMQAQLPGFLARAGHAARAKSAIESMLDDRPQDAFTLFHAGMTWTELGDVTSAEACFREALEFVGSEHELRRMICDELVELFTQSSREDEARELVRKETERAAARRKRTFEPLDGSPVRRDEPKVGRNDPCPCGSGKKFKKCCGAS